MAGEGDSGGPGDPADRAASDEALALRVQHGDGEAFDQLVRRYVRPIHATLASYLSETADVEDAAQETFLRALRAVDDYDPQRRFAPWLYQIARNVALNRLSSGRRVGAEPLSDKLPSALPGPDVMAERAELRARIDAAVARLPERRRAAFRLVDVEGYAVRDVARIMGLSSGTVRAHVHHARAALRASLADCRRGVENR